MEENKNGIPVLSGFTLLGKSNLDTRKNCATAEVMKSLKPEEVPEGMVVYVQDEDRSYRFNSRVTPDKTTGLWHRVYITEHSRVEDKTLILP